MDYAPDGLDLNNALVAQGKKKEDSDTMYAKMERPCLWTYKQRMIHH